MKFINKVTIKWVTIRSFLVHSDTEYRPIEFAVSHLWQNLDQSVGHNILGDQHKKS